MIQGTFRQPSKQHCVDEECQLNKACFAYDAMKNDLPEKGPFCLSFTRVFFGEPTMVHFKPKRRLKDE